MRIHQPRNNHAIPKIDVLNTLWRHPHNIALSPNRHNLAIVHQQSAIADASQLRKRNPTLRHIRIARDDSPS